MIGFIIVARLGSIRLPGKHLLMLNRRPVIEHIIKRIKINFKDNVKIIIATTELRTDDSLDYLSKIKNVRVYRGCPNNIPLRIFKVMTKYVIQKGILIEGDDVLFSIDGIKQTIKQLNKNHLFTATKGLPLGMNCYGFNRVFFEENFKSFKNLKNLETAWLRVFKVKPHEINFNLDNSYEKLRLTLDYKEDFELFKIIFENFRESIYKSDYSEIGFFLFSTGYFSKNNFLNDDYFNNIKKAIIIEDE